MVVQLNHFILQQLLSIFVSTGKVVALYSRFDVIVSLFYTFNIKTCYVFQCNDHLC